ncbi:Thiol:disulfide interchange protein [Anaerohalosphaera lusitana]|uniref:Thiol:disulfide interchange protein n=1 Tax=Anaerohalosphaera lusitana TaxID=1936003 RepID=A0A1U9NPP7_9BACT|nr:hypothetical protein [Anaerohalosphaera lusitana]AQT69901.1 Thiol:disulfide interchange protein [Anaerohalosphaera lusitana]
MSKPKQILIQTLLAAALISSAFAEETEKGQKVVITAAPARRLAGARIKKEVTWPDNYKQAISKAKRQKKDLLIAFTGAKITQPAALLTAKVLYKEDFYEKASRSFTMLNIDCPPNAKLNEYLSEQLYVLTNKYKVDNLPTLFITSPDGTPYQVTGFIPKTATPEKYLQHLLELKKKKNEMVDLFEKAEDEDSATKKAKLLDRALSMTNPALARNFHNEKIDFIITADKDNSLGLRNKYAVPRQLEKAYRAIETRDYKLAKTIIDTTIRELRPDGPLLQQLYYARSQAQFHLENPQGQLDSLNRALQAAPQSPMADQIKRTIAYYFTAPTENSTQLPR